MPSTGFTLPGTLANNADAGDVAWSDPGNAASSNNSYATWSSGGKVRTSQYLHATNFGFAIPAGATIDGIEVRVERSSGVAGSASDLRDHTVQLIKGGTRSGNNKADTATGWTTTDTNIDYGGAADLWGNTLTESDVEASNFGVAFRSQNVANGNQSRVDAIWINVHYTESGGGYDLVADAASFTYTAAAVTFRQTSIISASAASYAYNATAATFRIGHPVIAAAAVYAYTATATTIRKTSVIPAAAGSFTYSATDASLERGYVIPAAGATYTFSPQDLTWDRTYILAAAAGAYLYTGTAANIYHGRKLAIAAGTYVFTASNVDFIHTPVGVFILSADGAVYSFSSTAASIEHGYLVTGNSAVYTFTPTAADFIYTQGGDELKEAGFIANVGRLMRRG